MIKNIRLFCKRNKHREEETTGCTETKNCYLPISVRLSLYIFSSSTLFVVDAVKPPLFITILLDPPIRCTGHHDPRLRKGDRSQLLQPRHFCRVMLMLCTSFFYLDKRRLLIWKPYYFLLYGFIMLIFCSANIWRSLRFINSWWHWFFIQLTRPFFDKFFFCLLC